MKEFNISRLMNASPFIENISEETFDALMDFYIDTDASLDAINVDDNIVNGITESTITEFLKYNDSTDDVSTLVVDKENDFIAYWS